MPENLKEKKKEGKLELEKETGLNRKKISSSLEGKKSRYMEQISFSDLEITKSPKESDKKPELKAEERVKEETVIKESEKEESDNSKGQSSLFDF